MRRLHLPLATIILAALAPAVTVATAQEQFCGLFATLTSPVVRNAKPLVDDAATGAEGGSITGEVYVRERANGDDSLLVIAGNPNAATEVNPGVKIDEVRVKLPAKLKLNVGSLYPGWQAKQDGNNILFSGVPADIATFRMDSKETGKDDLTKQLDKKKVEVEIRSDGKTVFKQDQLITELPKATTGNTLNGYLDVPNDVSAGEVFAATLSENGKGIPDTSIFSKNFYLTGITEKSGMGFQLVPQGGLGDSPDRSREDGKAIWHKMEFYKGQRIVDSPLESVPEEQMQNWRMRGGIFGRVPDTAKFGDSFRFRLNDPFGETVFDATANQTRIVSPRDATCGPSLNGSAPQVFAGQTLCVCACVPDVATWLQILFDGQSIFPVAASTSTVILRVPNDAAPGRHSVTFNPGVKGGEGKVEFLVLKLIGDIDTHVIARGGSTTMRLRVQGTEDKLPLEIENKTTDIITLRREGKPFVKAVMDTSGGPANVIEGNVKGEMKGHFKIDYRLALPPCPCTDEIGDKGKAPSKDEPCTDDIGPRVTYLASARAPAPGQGVVVLVAAEDPSGIASVTINGTAATRENPDSHSFSATVPLPGNTEPGNSAHARFTIVARDKCRGVTTVVIKGDGTELTESSPKLNEESTKPCTDDVGPEVEFLSKSPLVKTPTGRMVVSLLVTDPSGVTSVTINGTQATRSSSNSRVFFADVIPTDTEPGTKAFNSFTIVARDKCRGVTTVTHRVPR